MGDRDPAVPARRLHGQRGSQGRDRLAGAGRGLGQGVGTDRVARRSSEENPAAQFTEATVRERRQGSRPAPGRRGPTFRFDQLKANQPARFADFLEQLKASNQPAVSFLHLLLPHQPWQYLPSGLQYSYPRINFGYVKKVGWTTQKAPVQLARQRPSCSWPPPTGWSARSSSGWAQGLYDKALVILTADHGISFTPGKAPRTLQDGNAHELMWVPLFVKTPQQRSGAFSDRNIEQVDLLPTIADILKVKVPWPLDGSVGHDAERSGRTKSFFNKPSRPLTVDGPSNQALALRGVTDRVARPQDGVDGLFGVGPFADLIGRQPNAVGVAGGSGLVARLNDPENLQDVDPDGGTVPALISGALTKGPPGGRPVGLAVAVNGRIGAVGDTFTQGDTPQTFATVVPESLFRREATACGSTRSSGRPRDAAAPGCGGGRLVGGGASDDQVGEQGDRHDVERRQADQHGGAGHPQIMDDQVDPRLDNGRRQQRQRDRHQHPQRVEVHHHPQHLDDVVVGILERMELGPPSPLEVVDRHILDRMPIGQERQRDRGHTRKPRRQQPQVGLGHRSLEGPQPGVESGMSVLVRYAASFRMAHLAGTRSSR